MHPTAATLVAELPWPEADPDLLAAETVTIAVQVMGKLRGTIVRSRRMRRAMPISPRPRPSRMSPARWRASGSSRRSTCRTGSSTSWSRMMRRRRMLAAGRRRALSGCGFQPVYMPTASGKAGVAQRELAAIQVDLIPDRPGQLLRQALQDRLEMGSSGVARRYELSVAFGISRRGHRDRAGHQRDPHSR